MEEIHVINVARRAILPGNAGPVGQENLVVAVADLLVSNTSFTLHET